MQLKRTLKLGSRGPDVRGVKRGVARARRPNGRPYTRLNGLTSTYGPFFRRTVKQFQRDHGLRVDGEVGPRTFARIEPTLDQYAKYLIRQYKPRPRPTKGEKVVSIAGTQVGVVESPWGSNSGRSVRRYQSACWLGGTGWPWCAAFVVWCWKETYGSVPRATAGAWDLTDNGGVRVSVANLKPGDAVSYDTGSGHVNLFVRDRGSYIETIGGNESNSVKRSMWPKHMIHSACRHPSAATGAHRMVGMSADYPEADPTALIPTEYDQADYDEHVQEIE